MDAGWPWSLPAWVVGNDGASSLSQEARVSLNEFVQALLQRAGQPAAVCDELRRYGWVN